MEVIKIFHIKPLQSGTRLNFTSTRTDKENYTQVNLLSGYGKFIAELKTNLALFPEGLTAVSDANKAIENVVAVFSRLMFDATALYFDKFGYNMPDATHHAWDLYAPILEKLINTHLGLYNIDKWAKMVKSAKVVV